MMNLKELLKEELFLLKEHSLEYDFAIIERLEGVSLPVDPAEKGNTPIGKLHVTLISGQALKPVKKELAKVWPEILSSLGELPSPIFVPKLYTAARNEKTTDFLAIENQQEYMDFVASLVEKIKEKIPSFVNTNSGRFFHVSVANNQGGNSFGSVGDINQADVQN